ncbi:hypothetical protein CS542_05885 [Pedobacter sp. IW39]|nr:hypothetical protein CS542_05885 [Pedobacter sp. IW39]
MMDGTSMACPAATGMAARILAGNPELLNLPRNQTRADEMVKYLSINIKAWDSEIYMKAKVCYSHRQQNN